MLSCTTAVIRTYLPVDKNLSPDRLFEVPDYGWRRTEEIQAPRAATRTNHLGGFFGGRVAGHYPHALSRAGFYQRLAQQGFNILLHRSPGRRALGVYPANTYPGFPGPSLSGGRRNNGRIADCSVQNSKSMDSRLLFLDECFGPGQYLRLPLLPTVNELFFSVISTVLARPLPGGQSFRVHPDFVSAGRVMQPDIILPSFDYAILYFHKCKY